MTITTGYAPISSGPNGHRLRPLMRAHIVNTSEMPGLGRCGVWWCEGGHYTDPEGLIEHKRQIAEMSLDYDQTIVEVLIVSCEDTASGTSQDPHTSLRTYEDGNRGFVYHEVTLTSFCGAEQLAGVLATLGESRWLNDALIVAQGLLNIIKGAERQAS